MIAALHAVDKSGLGGRNAAQNLRVPDFVALTSPLLRLVVIKSIDFVDRAGLFAQTVPGLRVILLLRDPRAVVASRIRGMRAGKFGADQVPESLVELEPARRRGLTPGQFRALPLAMQIAWNWLTVNGSRSKGSPTAPMRGSSATGKSSRRPSRLCGSYSISPGSLGPNRPQHLFMRAGTRVGKAATTASTATAISGSAPRRGGDVVSAEEARQIRDLVSDSIPGRLVM
ncbi:MAG: hypothetical protein ACREE2_09205 [Stellaceae bacterium]